MAHSPQSFLLMDTNCRTGCLELECLIFDPLASTFHLPNVCRSSESFVLPSNVHLVFTKEDQGNERREKYYRKEILI